MRWHTCLLGIVLSVGVHAADFSARFEEIKRTARPADLYTFLYALPKGGDLHNHLGGAIRSEWWYAVATDPARNGGDVFYTRIKFTAGLDLGAPLVRFQTIRRATYDRLAAATQADYSRLDQLAPEQRQAWLDSLRLDRPGEGREEFFTWIWPRTGQLHQSLPVVAETLVDCMKAFGAEGLRYLETQLGGMNYVDSAGNLVPPDTAADFLRARLAQLDALATGVTVRFQATGLRFLPNAEQQLEHLYQFVDGHRDLWVGINLAGIEENGKGYPRRFLEKFRELRRVHPTLPLSIHAGEMDGPDQHIRDTLLLMRNNRYLVEINLISNRLLEYTPDLRTHPFPEYLRIGVPVCLNTDDRGMWDSNLTDEYFTAVTTFNLSWEEVVQLGRNSLTYSFAQPELKARLLAEYEEAVRAFAASYQAADSLAQLKAVRPVTYGYAKRTWGFAFPPP